MSDTLYDEDILLWSERQAEIVRKLKDVRRDLPNDFDAENVAEEIESVGRSELAAVKSFLRRLLEHVLKLYLDPQSPARKPWLLEVRNFGRELDDRFAPSMSQRLALDDLWSDALDDLRLEAEERGSDLDVLPAECPFELRELIGQSIDADALAKFLRSVASESGRT